MPKPSGRLTCHRVRVGVRVRVGYAVGAKAEWQADVPPEVTSPVHGHVPTLIRLVRVRVRVRVSVRVQRGIPT